MTHRRSPVPFVLVMVVALGACVDEPQALIDPQAPPVEGRPVVYVAIGASETAGVGTEDPFIEAWPKVLWRDRLPEAVLYDLGRPGSTLAEAVAEQMDEAVRLEPDIVTVWLNVNDVIERVPEDAYEADLRTMLGALTTTGAAVLVASTPRIDSLPVYLACRPDPPPDALDCPADDVSLPPPDDVRALVAGYNEAIDRAATGSGAIVVDLQDFGDAPTLHPEWISSDGFHPSTRGAEVIAGAFARRVPAGIAEAAAAPR